MSQFFENGYALLIGVGRCRFEPWSLPVTSRDAEALKLLLTDPRRCAYPDENIRVLTHGQATRKGIVSALTDLRDEIKDVKNATVMLYFSGHGWTDQHGRFFLLVHDTTPEDFEETAIGSLELNELLRQLEPARLLAIFDTCHAGGMADVKEVLPGVLAEGKATAVGPADLLGGGRGRAVLSSCLDSETSLVLPEKHLSLFTQHLLHGFEGRAGRGDDDVIWLSDLMGYTSRKVADAAKQLGHRQTPFFRLATDDFPVAARTRPPAVSTPPEAPSSPEARPAGTETSSDAGRSEADQEARGFNTYQAKRDLIQVQTGTMGAFTTGASSHGSSSGGRRRGKPEE
ncbi:MAG: caspase family protein [Acidobacteriota bacterium]